MNEFLQVATRIGRSGCGPERLLLDLVNDSSQTIVFTVTSNNYRTDGPWAHRVTPGARPTDSFNTVAAQDGWYDFTVTCSADPSWSRRVVGHIETADPASAADRSPLETRTAS